MYKGIILTVESSFSWLNLLESSIGSLVGALVGGLIALWIAKSQIKKGEEQFDKQMKHNEEQLEEEMRHNNELRIKSDRVNLEVVKITKEYELEVQKLNDNKNKLFIVIESLENFQNKAYEFLNISSLRKRSDLKQSNFIDSSINARLLSAFATTLQYTYSFGYKHSNVFNNEELGNMFEKIEYLYDILDDLKESSEGSEESGVKHIDLRVVEKSNELLGDYIEAIEILERRMNEVHDKFEKDIKREHESLMELHK